MPSIESAAATTFMDQHKACLRERAPSPGSPPMKHLLTGLLILGVVLARTAAADDAKKLRIISWADYVPADVVTLFKKETGIQVEVTLSNNEEMISKLRATGGAGYDLAQPSQDRITGVQREFCIYKPLDLSKNKSELFIPAQLDPPKKKTHPARKGYRLPHLLGTHGPLV